MQTEVHWDLEGLPKAGNTGTTLFLHHIRIARSKFDTSKILHEILHVKIFSFVLPGFMEIFALSKNFLLYSTSLNLFFLKPLTQAQNSRVHTQSSR